MYLPFVNNWAIMPLIGESFMTKEVTKKQTTEVAAYTDADLAAWGEQQIDSNDIILPRINLAQQMSQSVVDDKAKMGDFVNTSTMTVIGGVDKPVDFIPFMLEQVWVIQKEVKAGKFEFDSIEVVNAENKDLPWDFVKEGVNYKRVYTRNFYGLVDGQTLPCVISFQGSSAKAGKQLATLMFAENRLNKLPPSAFHVKIGSKIEKNDDGTYAVKTIAVGNKSTTEEISKTLEWFKTFQKATPKVQHENGEF